MNHKDDEPLPLARFRLSLPGGHDGLREGLRQVLGWEPRDVASAPAGEPCVHRRAIRDAIFGYVQLVTDTDATFMVDRSSVVVLVPMSGIAAVSVDGEHMNITPGWAAVLSDAGQLTMRCRDGFRMLTLRADRGVLEGLTREMTGQPLGQPLRFERRMNIGSGHGQSWYLRWRMLVDEFAREGALMHEQWYAEQSERQVLTLFLQVHAHNYAQAIVRDGPAGVPVQRPRDPELAYPAYLRTALRLIREQPQDDHTTPLLARRVNIGERSLQMSFKEHLGVSPTTFVRNTRLDRVHETLLRSTKNETTVEKAFRRWGFRHQGHFTNHYTARFGEHPRITLARPPGENSDARVT
ncbi:AraC family transcriptional regulator [Phytoactinopolyspora halotolerans]|uniref:AraC family transcriptional regulator n=1 Tax=Phytoactinopolyspora halotolerans TaxID=1981512 RepID=A0A6L9SG57_9ACTN|nr:helix-turn-helix transcriptional regulator [Phytoactinopolyspora halotolerans]NEE03060.1 AraC family transcriptional regulator [Phytoactinopolyspora halotolerans]